MEWAGKRDEFLDEIQNQESLYETVKGIYLRNTKLKSKKLDDLMQHELWLDSKKCIDIGVVDSVYGQN